MGPSLPEKGQGIALKLDLAHAQIKAGQAADQAIAGVQGSRHAALVYSLHQKVGLTVGAVTGEGQGCARCNAGHCRLLSLDRD